MSSASFTISRVDSSMVLSCLGDWTIRYLSSVSLKLKKLDFDGVDDLTIDTTDVIALDTSGAWLLSSLKVASGSFTHRDSDIRHKNLLSALIKVDEVRSASEDLDAPPRVMSILSELSTSLYSDLLLSLHVLGESILSILFRPTKGRGIRLTSIVHQLDIIGFRAIPVIMVMAFLIGAVIAQQSAFLLEVYDEQLLSIDLVGILHLREIGVLLTAIMVSGRTGSSITAELGTMKMREELDALSVMGFNPISVLILPRMIALIIAVPLLTILSDLSGLFGAMVILYYYIDVSPVQFIVLLQPALDLSTVYSGLIKAPFMALAIGIIAFVEGLKVDGSAESLGFRTTVSVVRCIFAVIVIDCLFAIFYATIGY